MPSYRILTAVHPGRWKRPGPRWTPTASNSGATITGISHTAKIYGASLFVNLNDFPDEPVANRRVRLIIEALVAPDDAIERAAEALAKGAQARPPH